MHKAQQPKRWLKTLNVTDAEAHTDLPHCGSIGHVLPFEQSCELAATYGFDAVNADRGFIEQNGPDRTAELLSAHGLQPAAFALTAALNTCFSDETFDESLSGFENDLKRCRQAGFRTCVAFVQPSSDKLPFHRHFRTLRLRLKRLAPMLAGHDVRLGLEFIGPTTMRLEKHHDFLHTLDGLRGLIAAAEAEKWIGFKLDTLHWHTSGAGLLDIEKLAPEEVVYVELNDGLKGHDRFTLPEFERELPGVTGVVDSVGFLKTLDRIGFAGPVVVEPWNEKLRQMKPNEAVMAAKTSLDRQTAAAGIL